MSTIYSNAYRAGWLLVFMLIGVVSHSQYRYSQLVWSDEFDRAGLPDTSKWNYDRGRGCPNLCGWGNNEPQFYTWNRKENARVVKGELIIEAHKESYEGANYTSARITTKQKGDWTYGRFEVRAMLPNGVGTWPAIWLLPTENRYGGWPKSGEIDIAETVGYQKDTLHQTIHTDLYNGMYNTQRTNVMPLAGHGTAYHVYGIEWSPEKIEYYLDGKKTFTFSKEIADTRKWPFDQPFHLILNMAIGGDFGGKKGINDAIFPTQMRVDYVRIYQ
ncbi:MAG: glycoside hydrolase family 16 protein [Bacteroidota bacterium]